MVLKISRWLRNGVDCAGICWSVNNGVHYWSWTVKESEGASSPGEGGRLSHRLTSPQENTNRQVVKRRPPPLMQSTTATVTKCFYVVLSCRLSCLLNKLCSIGEKRKEQKTQKHKSPSLTYYFSDVVRGRTCVCVRAASHHDKNSPRQRMTWESIQVLFV